MKKKYIVSTTLLMLALCVNLSFAQQIGDPGWEFDQSRYDSKYPKQKRFAEAGVRGGIPLRASLNVRRTISPGDNIQNAINNVANMGGGVLLLRPGTYNVTSEIKMKRNVVVRGTSKTNTIISANMRSNNDKTVIKFEGLRNAGLEDLKFILPVSGLYPEDDRNNVTNKHCIDCHNNDPGGVTNLYIKYVNMNGSTENCWIDNCIFIDSGTDPIEVYGNHNTIRGSVIDGCYNKGGGGECYMDIRGNDNLFANITVKRIRHFAIQQRASHNVVINSKFINADVNFHNRDNGNNLIEANDFFIQHWRKWEAFFTGGPVWGHDQPGPNNIIYNNFTDVDGVKGDFSGPDKVYTYTGYRKPSLLTNTPPSGRTFYPIKRRSCAVGTPCNDGNDCTVGEVIDNDCNCTGGTPIKDADDDGVCDLIDQCNNVDDALIGTPCNDGDPCTINDIYTTNCKCEGKLNQKILVSPIDDAYIQGGNGRNENILKIATNRTAYMKFDLSTIVGDIESIKLILTNEIDEGDGTINVYLSNNVNWTENNLSNSNAPNSSNLVGSKDSKIYRQDDFYNIDLEDKINTNKPFTLILKQKEGNDASFGSNEFEKESSRPFLVVKVDGCITLAEEQNVFEEAFVFYPNPVKDKFTVEYNGNSSEIEFSVFDIMGKKITKTKMTNKTTNIDLSNFGSGIYLVSIKDKETGKTSFKKLIKY